MAYANKIPAWAIDLLDYDMMAIEMFVLLRTRSLQV
jgi:hypothetical protein